MLKTVTMRSSFGFIFICLFLVSCSDGDLIVTTFDFEDGTLNLCGDTETKVFYNINNENINETLSFKTTRNAFGYSQAFKDSISNLNLTAITNNTTPIIIQISSSNEVIYRTYDGEVNSNYFCNEIPPSTPKVLDEYKSVPGDAESVIEIITSVLGSDDDDGDTILNSEEGKGEVTPPDTDKDGIPDYRDVDDDGDNVLTINELNANINEPVDDNGRLDTDQDGIPNYLDDDDDGDGIDTKYEVTAADEFPPQNLNVAGTAPKFLDVYSKDDSFNGTPNVLLNTVKIKYVSTLTAKNIKFKKQGDNGEEISYTSFVLGTFTSSAIPTIIKPVDEVDPSAATTN